MRVLPTHASRHLAMARAGHSAHPPSCRATVALVGYTAHCSPTFLPGNPPMCRCPHPRDPAGAGLLPLARRGARRGGGGRARVQAGGGWRAGRGGPSGPGSNDHHGRLIDTCLPYYKLDCRLPIATLAALGLYSSVLCSLPRCILLSCSDVPCCPLHRSPLLLEVQSCSQLPLLLANCDTECGSGHPR